MRKRRERGGERRRRRAVVTPGISLRDVRTATARTKEEYEDHRRSQGWVGG